jgi:hypothetical protein
VTLPLIKLRIVGPIPGVRWLAALQPLWASHSAAQAAAFFINER